jgi:hypothetical protein
MSALAVCPGCERHVRTGEPSCPFCGARTIDLVAPPRRVTVRAGRLAALGAIVIGTACGSSAAEPRAQEPPAVEPEVPAEDPGSTANIYGGAPPPEAEQPPAEEEDPGSMGDMYGGPPLDVIV